MSGGARARGRFLNRSIVEGAEPFAAVSLDCWVTFGILRQSWSIFVEVLIFRRAYVVEFFENVFERERSVLCAIP